MKLTNSWKQWKYFDSEVEVDGNLIDVSRYVAVMVDANVTEVYFHRDGITPCISVLFDRLITPEAVLQLGRALERTSDCFVRLVSLKPRAADFAVEGRFLLPDNMEYQIGHFCEYGERISTLASAWSPT